MPYYEFFIYASSKTRLEEIRGTLVNLWEFDPGSASIQRIWRPWDQRLGTFLLSLVGVRSKNDWRMTITGPEIYREQAYTVAVAWDGFCGGGGYDFSYDPSGYYSDHWIRQHTELWEQKNRESESRYMAMLPEDEQARIRAARQDLTRHIRAHEDDEG